MERPTVIEFLSQGQTGVDTLITTAATTPVGAWIVAIHASEWDPEDRMDAPRGTIPVWNIIADTQLITAIGRIRVWAGQTTTPGAQRIITSPGDDDGQTANHLRVYVLDKLNPEATQFDFQFYSSPGSSIIAERLNVIDDALMVAVYGAGFEPGNFSGIPSDMQSRGELDSTFFSSLVIDSPNWNVIYGFNTTDDGWVGEGATSVARVTSPTKDGDGSLQATKTMSSGFDEMRFNDNQGPRDLTGYGTTLAAWVYVPIDAAGVDWQARLELQDAGFTWHPGDNFDVTPGEWTEVRYTPDPALMANCRSIGFAIGGTNVSGSQSVYVDTVIGRPMTAKSVTFSAPDVYTMSMIIALMSGVVSEITNTITSSRWASQALTTAPMNTLLDLPRWQGQRVSTFVFEVINGVTGERKGFFNPVRNRVPRLSHDSTRTISRSINLTFTPSDTIRFVPLTDRMLIWMQLSDGTLWPLGRYMATDKTTLVMTSGDVASVQFVDEMFIVDQKLDRTFNPLVTYVYPALAPIRAAILELLRPTGIPVDIEASPYNTFSTWDIGTSRAKVLSDLCVQGGYLKPWMGNDGRMKIIRAFEPSDRIPSIDLDTNSRVMRNSIARSDDFLNAANRVVVISNSGLETEPIVGTYDIPADAPHSVQNRGFVIPEVYDINAQTTDQALSIARTIAQQTIIFERVSVTTPVDPRHDGFDIVRWDGVNWLELDWTMDLIEGGDMDLTMRRVYT